MASDYKSNGTPLDDIFEPRGSTTKRPDTGFKENGTDIADRYYDIGLGGSIPGTDTGFKVNGTDIRFLFALNGSVTYGIGIFGGGWSGGLFTTYAFTERYDISNDSVNNGTNLGLTRGGLSAIGNSSSGIFSGGNNNTLSTITYSDKYTFSNNVVSVATSLITHILYAGAAGNNILGIFGGGLITPYSNITQKYTYSGDSVSYGTVLGLSRTGISASGNASLAIFAGGVTSASVNYTDKYTYSGDSVTSGTVMAFPNMFSQTGRAFSSSAGTSAFGIFVGGIVYDGGGYAIATQHSNKYTYSSDSVVIGTNLLAPRTYAAAAGNNINAVFSCGDDNGDTLVALTTTDKYIYSSGSVVSGTNLGVPRMLLAATSDAHGGLQ